MYRAIFMIYLAIFLHLVAGRVMGDVDELTVVSAVENLPELSNSKMIINGKTYHLLERIGKGGEGHVYKALEVVGNQLRNKPVALKIFFNEVSFEGNKPQELGISDKSFLVLSNNSGGVEINLPEGRKAFLLAATYPIRTSLRREYPEVKALAGLKYGIFTKETAASLRERIHATKNLLPKIIQLIQKMVRAGVLHSDVKLDNIALAEDGDLQLLDLRGLQKIEQATLTGVGFTVGYIAPEAAKARLQGQGAYQSLELALADVYSFGMILKYMLTGLAPLSKDAESTASTLRANDDTRVSFDSEGKIPAKEVLKIGDSGVAESVKKDIRVILEALTQTAKSLQLSESDLTDLSMLNDVISILTEPASGERLRRMSEHPALSLIARALELIVGPCGVVTLRKAA